MVRARKPDLTRVHTIKCPACAWEAESTFRNALDVLFREHVMDTHVTVRDPDGPLS